MRELRLFQKQLLERAREIVLGTIQDKVTVADITPGGGKSLGVSLTAKEYLDASFCTRVVWMTPRISLAEQAAAGFQNDWNPRYSLRIADNRPPFFRDVSDGCIGYTTTYQAVSKCPELHQQAFDQEPGKILLVLDELHHLVYNEEGNNQDLAQQKAWTEALTPLVASAGHVLVMSGTLERWDREPLPFVRYEMNEAGQRVPVRHIRYSRRDALAEKAILPIEITFEEGRATYRHRGSDVTQDIGTADEGEVSRVIRTFLADPEFREALIRRGLNDWTQYRESCYPSRAIVVCADQEMARLAQAFIRDEYNVGVVLAISDEPKSRETLRRFRDDRLGDVLVTVGMAYEGLDVPDCTHLICLTHIRSRPWLEQAFARVTRVDWNACKRGIGYDEQQAYVYAPRDPKMQDIIDDIRHEQELGLAEARERDERNAPPSEGGTEDGPDLPGDSDPEFQPISAESTGVRYGSVEEGQLSESDSALIDRVLHQFPEMKNMPSHRLLVLARSLREDALMGSFVEGTRRYVEGHRSPTQPRDPHEEERLRKTIEARARRVDRRHGWDHGTTNRRIVSRFHRQRPEMGVQELRRVLAYVERLERQKGS